MLKRRRKKIGKRGRLMKDIRFAAIVVRAALIISSCSLSSTISDGIYLNSSPVQGYETNPGIYQMEFLDGFLYLTDTESGRIWKKADDEESQWIELPHINE